MAFFSLFFTLFVLMDAPGNVPLFLALLDGFTPKKQKKIILREMIFAWIAMFIFTILGNQVLKLLNIHTFSIEVSGGVILFLIALKMIFPHEESAHALRSMVKKPEPFLVPMAIPLIAGPGVLTSCMLYADKYNAIFVLGAMSLAWLVSMPILILSPYISEKMGPKGIIATQRLMGLILVMIAIDLFLDGYRVFLSTYA